jgi:hypothetical protein
VDALVAGVRYSQFQTAAPSIFGRSGPSVNKVWPGSNESSKLSLDKVLRHICRSCKLGSS